MLKKVVDSTKFAEIKIFDYELLCTRLAGMMPIIKKIMEKSKEDLTLVFETINEAVREDEIIDIKDNSHKLKGAAATIACLRLSEYSQTMEYLAQSNQWHSIKELIPQMEICCIESVQALTNKLHALNA